MACSAPCTRQPITVEGSCFRPTPRKSPRSRHRWSSAPQQRRRSAWKVRRAPPPRPRSQAGCLPRDRRELLGRKRLATRVGEQPVDHSGNVSHVKRRRRHTGRAAVPFLFRQPGNHFTDALAHLEKDVGDRLKDSGNTLDGTTLPPLCVCHRSTPSGFSACQRQGSSALRARKIWRHRGPHRGASRSRSGRGGGRCRTENSTPAPTPGAACRRNLACRPTWRPAGPPAVRQSTHPLSRRSRRSPSSSAGIGGGAHAALPLSSASISMRSSQWICQAMSCAVRDFGSGRYCEPSGIRASTVRVVLDSLVQKFVNSDFSFRDVQHLCAIIAAQPFFNSGADTSTSSAVVKCESMLCLRVVALSMSALRPMGTRR